MQIRPPQITVIKNGLDDACGSPEQDWSRRRLLKNAALSGLPWVSMLASQLARAEERKPTGRPKSLIIIWLDGGASQLETFDPHPTSPIAYGAQAIDTALDGVQFGAGLEQTAELIPHFSVVRSMVSKEGDHSRAIYNLITGQRLFPGIVHPTIGAILCHELPGPAIEIPAHVSILAGQFSAKGGYLGASFDAFQMGDPRFPVPDMRPRVDEERDTARLKSLDVLEKSFSQGRIADLDQVRTQHLTNLDRARLMMTSSQLAAFDVSQAPASERDPFGDTPFGRGCLAAIRLIEAGVRCVEITLNGWDTHTNNHENQRRRIDILDPALASLFRALQSRDLYKDTIVVCATEFGRTPRLNPAEGRDHWPHGFSVLLGGGGIASGRVIGSTDPEGEMKVPEAPISIEDLHATIHTALGIDHTYEIETPIGRPVPISDGRPVAALLV